MWFDSWKVKNKPCTCSARETFQDLISIKTNSLTALSHFLPVKHQEICHPGHLYQQSHEWDHCPSTWLTHSWVSNSHLQKFFVFCIKVCLEQSILPRFLLCNKTFLHFFLFTKHNHFLRLLSIRLAKPTTSFDIMTFNKHTNISQNWSH